MEQYIKKSALVGEIQDKINKIDLNSIQDWRCRIQREHDIEVMKNILSLINTLEVKEVDLEKELNMYLEKVRKTDEDIMFGDFARHFFELGLKVQKGE